MALWYLVAFSQINLFILMELRPGPDFRRMTTMGIPWEYAAYMECSLMPSSSRLAIFLLVT